MKMRRAIEIAAALGGISALMVGSTVGPAAGEESSSEEIRLCLDSAGIDKSGDLDVLLLIDDSGSLQHQDPDNHRFDAIGVLLDGLTASVDARDINVAIATFGARIDLLFDFQPLTLARVDQMVSVAVERATGRQLYTDYVAATRASTELFGDRPSLNCKLLVWFTDGEHDLSDSLDPQIDRQESDELRDEFCGEGGLGARIRSLDVNTFVLLLDPPRGKPLRLEASEDVMQVLTGDPRPGFIGRGDVPREPSGLCDGQLGDQVGRILPVERADELPGLFADLQNELEGGRRATRETCPYPVGPITTDPLPDGHLVRWLALTDFQAGSDAPPIDPSRLTVVVNGNAHPGDRYLELSWHAGPSTRFTIATAMRDELRAGWQMRLDDATSLCLRVRAVDLAFVISTSEPAIRAVQPSSLPPSLFDGEKLELISGSDGAVLPFDEALRTPGIRGQLHVEHGMVFSSTSTLPASVEVDGAPRFGAQCAVVQVPAPGTVRYTEGWLLGQREAPREPLESSECVVHPATVGDEGGQLDATVAIAALNDERSQCALGEWSLYVGGERHDSGVVDLDVVGSPLLLQLRSTAAPPNEEVDCLNVALSHLTLTWQDNSSEIPVVVSATWLRRSSPLIAGALAGAIALLGAALSLLLLRFVSYLTAVPPDPRSIWAYQANGSVAVSDRNALAIAWDGDTTALRFEHSSLQAVRGDGRRMLKVGSDRLVRVMPPWLRPWSEPVLRFDGDRAATVVSQPAAPGTSGALPIAFRDAIIVSTDAQNPPTSDRPMAIVLTLLVPQNLDDPAEELIAQLVHNHLDALVHRLVDALGSSSGSDVPGSAQGMSGSTSGPPGARPDPPQHSGSGGSSSHRRAATPPGIRRMDRRGRGDSK